MAANIKFELTLKANEQLNIEDIIAIKKLIAQKLRDNTVPMHNKITNSVLQFIGVSEQ